ARNASPMKLTVRLADSRGICFGQKTFSLVRTGRGWTKYRLTLTADGCCNQVFPEILLETPGAVDLDLLSLFPQDTFLGRKNGMRRDLAQMLQALSPKFMRFPGGCIVEGRSFENMYCWKDTIGDLTQRRTNWNRWQMEEYQINGQVSLDYFQSYGLGFYEYFQFCEDIGASPVPVINAGMTCQWHEGLLADMNALDKWIQDALDLIEFANGPADSTWGGRRAAMGHPEPFRLKYIGIGNEQWGEVYFERYEAFQKVLSEKHPEIRLITSAGWTAEGEEFDLAYRWMNANKDKAYAVDEHFYKSPRWFLENIHRYDSYDRSLPKVFAGEYAAHTHENTGERVCNWEAALCEAAFLTGLEHNADHVVMSCYAPLFGRTGHQQWQPDLIWFDNHSAYGTPSYYVQKLFANHVGDTLVETRISEDEEALSGLAKIAGKSLQVSSTLSENGLRLYVKLVNLSDTSREVRLRPDQPISHCIRHEIAAGLEAVNSHETPENVSPRVSEPLPRDGSLLLTCEPYSVNVLELDL
ncbi:MAG: alpha-L-arabinofuranosidase, partial [Acetatifactor sp.]|nr:alpha-L-arabinofuranosidase [Acetatifactor sp.]